MYPADLARLAPDRPALIMGSTGEVVTYRELDERSNRLAHHLRSQGLRVGDHLAVFLENHVRYLEVVWAALRSGLVLTSINRYLGVDEASYILEHCDARALITSHALKPVAERLPYAVSRCATFLVIDGPVDGFAPYEDTLGDYPASCIDDEQLGNFMLYSSGTTGRPKGVSRPLSGRPASAGHPLAQTLGPLLGFDEHTVYLSTAPMYHSAPLAWATATQTLGGTVVMMERFDAEAALRLIAEHRVTHSQWVPTMFTRLLALPEEARVARDLSSHVMAAHGAAPCPIPVKQAMLDWWGPKIYEYYGGTESNGLTLARPSEWLSHPGTVGVAIFGRLHICGPDGEELPVGREGVVYFEMDVPSFAYYKDDGATESAQHPDHPTWTALGDMGRVDDDGYLYLTDRLTFMIVSGGVNIYPREIEECLLLHPAVEDVAVFGVPNEEYGEEVKAIVQCAEATTGDAALADELQQWCRDRLAAFKCPRSVEFEDELPRLPTGKLYKRVLRDRYWAGHASGVV
jgi:long-chain acyl-CoA synthetase